jgi:hypothetical protein
MSPELFENYAQTLITQILEPTGTPFAVCFHPVNFVRFARQAEERFMKKAKSLGAKIIADDAWLDFWQMRCSWRLVKQERNESGFAYHLQGDQASKDLSVTFPTTFKQKSIDRITIDGEDCRTELINHFGMKRFLFVVPDGITECQINIKIN